MKTYADVLKKIHRPLLCPRVQWEYLVCENVPCEDFEQYYTVFQWYLIDDDDADFLISINEPVYYHRCIDMFVWGVCHYGTPWENVPLMFDKCIMPDNFTCNTLVLSQLMGYSDLTDFYQDGYDARWLTVKDMECVINIPALNQWLEKMGEKFRVVNYDTEKKIYNCRGGLL